MSDKPKFVGMQSTPDAVVTGYQQAAKKRAEQRREAARGTTLPKIPNLAQANKSFNPHKDPPMTLNQMAEAQANIDKVIKGDEPARLSQDTVAGLAAIRQAAEEERKKMTPETQQADTPAEKEDTATAEPTKKRSEAQDKAAAEEALNSMDDMDLELLMNRVRSDVINNERERKAVEKRVKEIDLASGLATGEFTQVVPIKPTVFEVEYRTTSQMENDHMRRILFNWNAEDARVATMSAERYGLMQTVAAIVRINGEKMPKHIDEKGNFDEKTFLAKYKLISGYPTPLIHSLGTHAYWFDERVRKLFTSVNLKNG